MPDALPIVIRIARPHDAAVLSPLMECAIAELLQPWLSPAQVRASREIMGIDTQLIADDTYFVAEVDGTPVGCGGWSRRATHFGGDHSPDRDARPLDPATEPARVRAMYTHPEFARRGVGRAILARCEEAAAAEGFTRVALVATMAGLPLYRACGYSDIDAFDEITPGGIAVPLVRMEKSLVLRGAPRESISA
jgi:GNAT superfamily N-acetyltransferase